MDVRIVGMIEAGDGGTRVHTIDVWFSRRSGRWLVERLDEHGDLIGSAHHCATQADALDCIADWLRAHPETYLVAPHEDAAARKLVRRIAKHAA